MPVLIASILAAGVWSAAQLLPSKTEPYSPQTDTEKFIAAANLLLSQDLDRWGEVSVNRKVEDEGPIDEAEVFGAVRSAQDAEDLRTLLETVTPPVPVTWHVRIG